MKNNKLSLMVILMLFWGSPTFAASSKESNASLTNTDSARSVMLIERQEQINKIDKSSLSRVEKKTLRREEKEIDAQLKESNRGVFLSVGAIVIIILLVILLV